VDGGWLPWGPRCACPFRVTSPSPSHRRGGAVGRTGKRGEPWSSARVRASSGTSAGLSLRGEVRA
jgi:hypothetical protein